MLTLLDTAAYARELEIKLLHQGIDEAEKRKRSATNEAEREYFDQGERLLRARLQQLEEE